MQAEYTFIGMDIIVCSPGYSFMTNILSPARCANMFYVIAFTGRDVWVDVCMSVLVNSKK